MISISDHDHVRVVRFDRQDVRNAFDVAMYEAVTGALAAAAGDDAVHAVVLTGAGSAFSSGQDLAEMAKLAEGTAPPGAERGFRDLLEVVQSFELPLIAAVNGVAVGLGATILCHCDLVLVGESARLRLPFAAMGVPAEAGSSYLLPARVGRQHAAHLLFTSDWMDADEAVRCGLAWRRVADGDLLDAALEVAQRIAVHPTQAVRELKRLLVAAELPAVEAARAREEAAFARLFAGGDAAIGLVAPGPATMRP